MALSQDEKDALEVISTEIENAASWNTGARETYLLATADKIRKVIAGDGADLVAADKAEAERQAEIEAAREAAQNALDAAEKANAKGKATSKS